MLLNPTMFARAALKASDLSHPWFGGTAQWQPSLSLCAAYRIYQALDMGAGYANIATKTSFTGSDGQFGFISNQDPSLIIRVQNPKQLLIQSDFSKRGQTG